MSITSGGMGGSIGEAFGQHGFGSTGGGFEPVGMAPRPQSGTPQPGGTFEEAFRAGAGSRTLPQYTLSVGGVALPGLYSYNQVEEFMGHGTINGQRPQGLPPQGAKRARRLTPAQMTPAQRRVAQIFLNSQGQRVNPQQVISSAISRLIAGQPLTRNQLVALGQRLLQMSPTQRRNFTNQLALARFPGRNVNQTQGIFNGILGQAMAAARQAR